MKKTVGVLVSYIVLGLVIALLWSRLNQKVEPEVITNTITKYLPSPVPDTITNTKYTVIYRDTGSHTIKIDSVFVRIPVPVDTTSIVKDYLTARHYEFDTTINDVHSVTNIGLYANRVIKYSNQITNLKTCVDSKFSLYAGGICGRKTLGPALTVTSKKMSYTIAYDIVGSESGMLIAIQYKIK